jgi:hypothetical protein
MWLSCNADETLHTDGVVRSAMHKGEDNIADFVQFPFVFGTRVLWVGRAQGLFCPERGRENRM